MPISRSIPIVTLTTDFGSADHYAGTMKGVILSRCPKAQVVDISHEVPPFNIYAGAYTVSQAAPFFPLGTIHVVVVDPGVGTARKPLLLEASGQFFVAPDNGVLSIIADRDPNWNAREITNSDLFLPSVSGTFHGRDVFAPSAAGLASGAGLEDIGPRLEKIELLPDLEPEATGQGEWRGRILSVDRFGNVITNFRSDRFPSLESHAFRLQFGSVAVSTIAKTFGEAAADQCFAYHGSSGYIEAGINQASAARKGGVGPGDQVRIYLVNQKRQ